MGVTLDQIGSLAETYPVKAEVRHAGDSSVEEFRSLASGHLGQKDHYVIVNYLRRAIGQERGGHIPRWPLMMPIPTASSCWMCRDTSTHRSGSRRPTSSPR